MDYVKNMRQIYGENVTEDMAVHLAEIELHRPNYTLRKSEDHWTEAELEKMIARHDELADKYRKELKIKRAKRHAS